MTKNNPNDFIPFGGPSGEGEYHHGNEPLNMAIERVLWHKRRIIKLSNDDADITAALEALETAWDGE